MSTIANRRSVMMLYSSADSIHCHRVRLVLAEKDITVDIETIDPDNKPEDLLHLNPYNSIPTLIDRDLVLYDARVISEYLDERFPHPPLMPVDPVSRAQSRLALYRIEQDWYSLLPDLESGDAKKQAKAAKILRDSLIAAADVFAVKPFFLSDEFSLVDATLAPLLWRLGKYGIELPGSAKAVTDYADRLFRRDAFELSLSEAEREMR
ncbi:glutathione S-transferase N-terminal domain-containing protein [Granulosicoccaceae sp. 1_MG-2023]|nr:glutathione S-transferase N-terminal domain-containing protein [Granulosicoccaceae sp. 1_MG-2023]